jgi:hypothetical protein
LDQVDDGTLYRPSDDAITYTGIYNPETGKLEPPPVKPKLTIVPKDDPE